jgi:ketosteroid isomerase-like protein
MDDLERRNERWNRAWLERDAAAVDDLAADGYVYVGPQGQGLDRSAILEIVHSPSYRLKSGAWTEVAIHPLGDDTALVLDRFTGAGEYRGQEFDEDHRRTSVWVRRDGSWQVRHEHCSPIASD